MNRRLLSAKWVVTHLVVVALTVSFVLLGMWQLDRLEERRETNRVGSSRFAAEPVAFETLADAEPSTIEFRRVHVTGRVLGASEVLIRSQVHQGIAGYHLVVPVSNEAGSGVLINRGWVPMETEIGEIDHGTDEGGVVTIEGWAHLTQERPALGPADPAEGRLVVMNRIDIGRIQYQVEPEVDLADVYIVETGQAAAAPPFPLDPPDFEDEGPHLAYAVQWFGFAMILGIGYVFLMRRSLRQPGSTDLASSSTTS